MELPSRFARVCVCVFFFGGDAKAALSLFCLKERLVWNAWRSEAALDALPVEGTPLRVCTKCIRVVMHPHTHTHTHSTLRAYVGPQLFFFLTLRPGRVIGEHSERSGTEKKTKQNSIEGHERWEVRDTQKATVGEEMLYESGLFF
jgi:hypothetical protein